MASPKGIKELQKACLADRRIQKTLQSIWTKRGWGKYPIRKEG